MITKDNLKNVFDLLTENQINEIFQSNNDTLSLTVNGLTVNGYGYVSLTSVNPENYEEEEENCISTGGIFCDKDTLLQLFKESESINPFLIELI
jgi:hypothetical protein